MRDKYNGIVPDDFKTMLWNWVILESDVPDDLIKELIRHSEVIGKLPKKKQEEYRNSRSLANFPAGTEELL